MDWLVQDESQKQSIESPYRQKFDSGMDWCLKFDIWKNYETAKLKEKKEQYFMQFLSFFPYTLFMLSNRKTKKMANLLSFFFQISWIVIWWISVTLTVVMTWTKLFQIFIIFQQNCFTNVRTEISHWSFEDKIK